MITGERLEEYSEESEANLHFIKHGFEDILVVEAETKRKAMETAKQKAQEGLTLHYKCSASKLHDLLEDEEMVYL